jgi:hypothetical protein
MSRAIPTARRNAFVAPRRVRPAPGRQRLPVQYHDWRYDRVMPTAPLSRCRICGRRGCRPALHPESRRDRDARDALRRPSLWAERKQNAALVHDWVTVHGWLCPGDGPDHVAHYVAPGQLTADHLHPIILGGARVGGPMRVLCKSRNSALGARLAHPRGRKFNG